MNLPHDESGTVIGYVWPKMTRCPECNGLEYVSAGYTREGRIQYRRCLNPQAQDCPRRNNPYKIAAIGMHVDRGGEQSEIVGLT